MGAYAYGHETTDCDDDHRTSKTPPRYRQSNFVIGFFVFGPFVIVAVGVGVVGLSGETKKTTTMGAYAYGHEEADYEDDHPPSKTPTRRRQSNLVIGRFVIVAVGVGVVGLCCFGWHPSL